MNQPDDGLGPPKDPGAVAPDTEAIQSRWEHVIDDMETTAAEFRHDGWAVLELHPGDVAAVGPERAERWGLELLLPDGEFRQLEDWIDGRGERFDTCEVWRASGGGIVYLVVAMLDADAERAVVYPSFYDPARAAGMLEAVESAGELPTHLRPLKGEPVVTFAIDEPALVLPED